MNEFLQSGWSPDRITRTFHWLAVPGCGHFCDRVRHCPVLIPNFHQSQRSLSSMPSCSEYVGTSARHGILFTGTNDNRFCADRREPVNVSSDVELHDVILGQYLRSEGI